MARLVIDAMNMIGTRPTGWWRDVDGAVRQLLERLGRYAEQGGDEITVVLDGRVPAGVPLEGADNLAVIEARRGGRNAADDRIVELVEADSEPSSLTVITSDRELRRRVSALGAHVSGPAQFLDRLDSA